MGLRRFCIQCGRPSEAADARFCAACGSAFPADAPPPRRHETAPIRLPTRWWARALPIAAGVLVLAAGVVAVVYVVRPDALGPVGEWLDERLEPAAEHEHEARPASHPGLAWHGIEGGERDITVTAPAEGADGAFVLDYRSVDREGAEVSGTLRVHTMGPRLSALLVLPDGSEARAYNGMFSPDGRFVSGTTWELSGSAGRDQSAFWWATVERDAPSADAAALDVNRLSVAALEREGLSPRVARLIVEGRLVRGPYLSLDPLLDHPHVPPAERRLLRERAVVR